MKSPQEMIEAKTGGYYRQNCLVLDTLDFGDVRDLMEEYAAQFKPKWISVKEKLSKHKGLKLVWIVGLGFSVAYFDMERFWINGVSVSPTYWMSLSLPPKTE